MIVFDLECRASGHRFEGWFSSSDDFSRQQERGFVTCPSCGSAEIVKAVMAPNVGRKGNQMTASSSGQVEPANSASPVTNTGPSIPPQLEAMFRAVASAQAEALKSSRWVGEDFAETARAMHYGEQEVEQVHGQASLDEARELAEEGIPVAPVLFPVVPPGKAN